MVAEGSAANYVKRILAKLGFRSRAQVAAWASRLPPDGLPAEATDSSTPPVRLIHFCTYPGGRNAVRWSGPRPLGGEPGAGRGSRWAGDASAAGQRLPLAAGLALLCWLVSVAAVLAATFDVNTTADIADLNLGDGLCDVDAAAAGSQCTLRAAVQQANVLPSTPEAPHVINLPAETFTLTIPGRDELAGATGDLNLTAAGIRIVGQGATQTIVQAGTAVGSGIDRVFRVAVGSQTHPGVADGPGRHHRHGSGPCRWGHP